MDLLQDVDADTRVLSDPVRGDRQDEAAVPAAALPALSEFDGM
jgi:hypothetical protein